MRTLLLGITVIATTLLVPTHAVLAQAFPSKLIRIVMPLPAGGSVDLSGRRLMEDLAAELGQPVVVENRTGAGTLVGTEAAARAPADGYTLLLGALSNIALNPGLYPKLAYDPLYGTGRGYLNTLLAEAGTPVTTIHDYRDVLFSGVGPEPSEKNLAELSQFVRENQCALGVATDGDADRFGFVDADGAWIQPNYVLALLADYLIEVRRIPGGLGRSVATTHLIDAVARHHQVSVYQTPVGFKYIGELIKGDKLVLGGEESAGLSIRGHLPEKDGILACLLVAEMVAQRGQSLKQQLDALFRKVGPCYPVRVNLSLQPDVKRSLLKKLARDWETFGQQKVVKIDRTDGLKLIRADGSWVLMRASGTEPVVRVYCEAASPADLESLVTAAKNFVAAS